MKQKVSIRDMAFGAVIMLIGLVVGAIVSPPLIAQRNGVFGEIKCTGLTVVDKDGSKMIVLSSDEIANTVSLYDTKFGGSPAVTLGGSEEMNYVVVHNKISGGPAVFLYSDWKGANAVKVKTYHGREAVRLASHRVASSITGEVTNNVSVIEKAGKMTSLGADLLPALD